MKVKLPTVVGFVRKEAGLNVYYYGQINNAA